MEHILTSFNLVHSGAGNESKVGVAGSGAGGNIAATVAHEVPGIAYQVC